MNAKQERLVKERVDQRLAIEQQNKLGDFGIRSALHRHGNTWQLTINEEDRERAQEVLNVQLPISG